MKALDSVAVFHVSHLEASVKYYKEILGFTEEFRHDDYVGLKLGEAGLHLSGHKALNRPIGGGTAYFFCDEVDSYYAEINKKGAFLKGEPQEYFYGMRDFIALDPDGNHLSFGCKSLGA
jgi:catechol 2,3-dioxygenase-like lactoylglutathione lyase family enzyme